MTPQTTLSPRRRKLVLATVGLRADDGRVGGQRPQRRAPGPRPRHRGDPEPDPMDRRRVHDRLRRPAARRRRGRRPLRAQGRPARRPGDLRQRGARRDVRERPERPHRPARPDGRRRRLRHADDAVGHHDLLPRGGARPRGRRVGRDRGRRRRHRPAGLRHPARVLQLELVLRAQRHAGAARRRRHAPRSSRTPATRTAPRLDIPAPRSR